MIRKSVFAFLLLLLTALLPARERQDILKHAFEQSSTSFKTGGEWFPYPSYTDRDAWNAMLGEKDRADLISHAEKVLDYTWQIIPATAYLNFERTGDRQGMESIYYANRKAIQALMIGELLEGEGRFVDQMINGLWHSCQMFSWIGSAHQDRQRTGRALPDERELFIDLASASYGAVMAVAYHFFKETFDSIDPSISYAIKSAVKRNILDPYMDDDELFANRWLALASENPDSFVNNWTPWCNSNVALAYLLVEDDPLRLQAALYRSACSVDEFLEYTKTDGACEEGPSYWPNAAGRLYDYLQIMYDASNGAFNLLDNVRIRETGEFISRAAVGNGYVVNFADANAREPLQRDLIWNYGLSTGSAQMRNFSCSLMGNEKYSKFYAPVIPKDEIYRTLHDIRNRKALQADIDALNAEVKKSSYAEVKKALVTGIPASTWYPDTQIAYLRNAEGWFYAAKGGHNNESHNHNDVGTCVLFIDNTPVLVDAGVGVYTRQTFSSERYSLWTMISPFHNLISPNSAAQPQGVEYHASKCGCDLAKGVFEVDLSSAYGGDACVKSLERSYSFGKTAAGSAPVKSECGNWSCDAVVPKGGPEFVIRDKFSLSKRTAPDVEHLLVKGEVFLPGTVCESLDGRKTGAGEIVVLCDNNLAVSITFPTSLTASCERIELNDRRLRYAWGNSLTRISLTSGDKAPLTGTYTMIVRKISK